MNKGIRTFKHRLGEDLEGFTLKTLEKIAEATGTRLKIQFIAA